MVDICLAQRAEAFCIEWEQGNGEDLYAKSRAITHKAMERAHNESKPTVIEFDTYRYYGHSVADAKHKGGYRKEEEIEKYKNEHDPIRLFQNRLMAEKVLTEEQYEAIDAELKSEATAAARFADESPPPTESSVFEDVCRSRSPDGGRSHREIFLQRLSRANVRLVDPAAWVNYTL